MCDQQGRVKGVKGLVLTVGGTPEPIVFTIRSLRPAHVALVCSEHSLATATAVKASLHQPDGTGREHAVRTFRTDDETDLVACHKTVAEALAYLREECGLERDAIRVDYTGGTKTMSAAAVLAAAPDGFEFVYVAGDRRDRQGLGTVLSGSERIVFPPNPWTVLEEPDLRALLAYAAVGQWQAAQDRCRGLINRADAAARPVFAALREVLHGLRYWDGFDHKQAKKIWTRCPPTRLRELALVTGRQLIAAFAGKCVRMFQILVETASTVEGCSDQGTDPLVVDLLANADRRAGRGLRDEAALRLYRAVEMCAQRRLAGRYRISNDAVEPPDVPEPLRSELEKRHGEARPAGWKLGLRDSASLLEALGDAIGASVARTDLDLGARNTNWLIHGTQHVTAAQLRGFRTKVLEALKVKEGDIPAWPDFAS